MELSEIRAQIDTIDDELVRLFCQRMRLCGEVAAYKKEHGLPILMPTREQEKLDDVSRKAGPEMEAYTRAMYEQLFALSRDYQSTLL